MAEPEEDPPSAENQTNYNFPGPKGFEPSISSVTGRRFKPAKLRPLKWSSLKKFSQPLILNNVARLGFFAPLAFIPIHVLATVLFVPTALLALAAGAFFGVPVGFAVALASSLAGASAGFLAGRYLSRGGVLEKAISNKKIQALDNAVAEKGWKIVLLLRLSAICPFMLLNYGLGLSRISFKRHILVSSIGMIPGTLLYVYLGSLAGKMVFSAEPIQKTPLEWACLVVGFSLTIGMGVYATWIVKKSLKT